MIAIMNNIKLTKYKFPFIEMLLLLVAIFWGTSYGLTKEALAYSSVLLFIALRFSITFLCLLPFVIGDMRSGLNKDWLHVLPTGGVLSAIFICEVYGVSNTSAANAAFLISLFVIFTTLMEVVINKNRIPKHLIILAICSVSGVFLLTSSQQFTLSLNLGDYLVLAAALLRAIMVTVTKRSTQGSDITTATITAIQSLIVAIVSIILLLSTSSLSELTLPTSKNFWFIMTYLVLFCTLFAFFVQNYAVRKTSPTRVSLLMGSEPLFGAIFAMLWLGESLTLLQMFGGSLILGSVVITSLSTR